MSKMTVRMQENGRVTIPAEIRGKLGLKRGDRVIFEETAAGVILRPAEIVVTDALDEIGETLQAGEITLEELLERGRGLRGSLATEMYGLEDKPVK